MRLYNFYTCLLGSGKTHYINNRLDSDLHNKTPKVISSINETFNKTEVVQQLIELSLTTYDLALFLNINLVWPQVSDLSF